MNAPRRRIVIRPLVVYLAFAAASPALLSGAAAGDLDARLEAAMLRFPALLVEGEAVAAPDVVVVAGVPEDVEGPVGLGMWREGTVVMAAEPRSGGPALVGLGLAAGSADGSVAARRIAVARRAAVGAPPQEAVVLALPDDAPGNAVLELDLDPRIAGFEVWSVREDGTLETKLSGGRPWGGRSLYLEAEPGGLYVVTLSYPWQ